MISTLAVIREGGGNLTSDMVFSINFTMSEQQTQSYWKHNSIQIQYKGLGFSLNLIICLYV